MDSTTQSALLVDKYVYKSSLESVVLRNPFLPEEIIPDESCNVFFDPKNSPLQISPVLCRTSNIPELNWLSHEVGYVPGYLPSSYINCCKLVQTATLENKCASSKFLLHQLYVWVRQSIWLISLQSTHQYSCRITNIKIPVLLYVHLIKASVKWSLL